MLINGLRLITNIFFWFFIQTHNLHICFTIYTRAIYIYFRKSLVNLARKNMVRTFGNRKNEKRRPFILFPRKVAGKVKFLKSQIVEKTEVFFTLNIFALYTIVLYSMCRLENFKHCKNLLPKTTVIWLISLQRALLSDFSRQSPPSVDVRRHP